jgi:hypothetical protein
VGIYIKRSNQSIGVEGEGYHWERGVRSSGLWDFNIGRGVSGLRVLLGLGPVANERGYSFRSGA